MTVLILLFVVLPAGCALGIVALAPRVARAARRIRCALAANRRTGSIYPVTFWMRLGVM
jgi:hypothetical protein